MESDESIQKSPLQEMSMDFAVRIVALARELRNGPKEYALADQVLRSGTSIGANLAEARKPVIRTLDDGTKIGFLAYCSILPQDYWANEERAGANPLRGVTAYVPKEHDQPETPIRMFSFPHPDDLDNMLEDIAKLRPQVDILMVSFHWGIHFIPAVIAYYQRYAAKFAIDAGADIIIGHHEHILKPIEVYKGKVIIYGMANFGLEGPEKFFEGKFDF